jgi:hypothetical protein
MCEAWLYLNAHFDQLNGAFFKNYKSSSSSFVLSSVTSNLALQIITIFSDDSQNYQGFHSDLQTTETFEKCQF